MVDMATYAFIPLLVGLVVASCALAYTVGKEDGHADALRAKADWRVVEVPVDAHTIAFHVRHRRYEYTSVGSFEIGQANVDDDDAMSEVRAEADQRAEEFNARKVIAK